MSRLSTWLENRNASKAGSPDAQSLKDALARQLQKDGYPFYTKNVPLPTKPNLDKESQ